MTCCPNGISALAASVVWQKREAGSTPMLSVWLSPSAYEKDMSADRERGG